MASKREQVLQAVEALIKAALPNAKVRRNPSTPIRIEGLPGGAVDMYDGDPGEPEVDLSPLTYTYSHRIALSFGGYVSASRTAAEVIDDMQSAVGAAVDADRSLNGLCEFVRTEAPDGEALEIAGAQAGGESQAAIIADYSTRSPL
jgi:hypothetical protein